MAALQWRASAELNLYVSAGRGFESPTLNELAYRPDGSAGFNTDLKAPDQPPGRARRQVARGGAGPGRRCRACSTPARDDEIGVPPTAAAAPPSRTSAHTKRQGAEIDLRWRIAAGLARAAGRDLALATYGDGFFVCSAVPCLTPDVPVPAGNRIAGTVDRSAYAELAWAPRPAPNSASKCAARARQPVNDTNSDFAAGYGLLGAARAVAAGPGPAASWSCWAASTTWPTGAYAGSVIVNEANQRFFEPAAGRNFLASARWSQGF